MNNAKEGKPYRKLMVMVVVSFFCMYALMYSMVDAFANVFSNINQFYMAGLMTMPMILIEIVVMGSMYMDKRNNLIIIAAASLSLVGFFMLIRYQTAVTDKQFLRSMIPHHAGAILMCEEADINDPEIKNLCKSIVTGQRKEIEQMKNKLNELEK